MVRVIEPTEYKAAARLLRAPHAGSAPIVIQTRPSLPSCSKPSRPSLRVAAAKAISLDGSCARQRLLPAAGRREETSSRIIRIMCVTHRLDKLVPIQG
jgi:hypothetical protein